MTQVLVVEDEVVIRNALKRLLERHEYQVSEAGTVKESLEKYDMDEFDVIISDLRLPGAPGTDLIKATNTPVLIMTSYSSIRSAIDSMKMGAVDYIAKPFEHNEIIETVGKIIREHTRPNKREKTQSDDHEPPVHGMIGSCPQMMELFRRIRKVALTNSTVLINGESGTGKELVARAIHNLSTRADQEMISVNCAAIPENLIESELFGHEKGAFTGATATRTGLVEAANGSTLFLDEIGELPLEAQARLLRVLQENEIRKVGSVQSKKVDVRLVVATHRDLKQLVIDGNFREDLYYRINVMTLLIPPLRERGNDILELADTILQRTCVRLKTPMLHFSDSASHAIAKYAWPGNVRELENAIERAVVLAEETEISEELLAIDNEAEEVDEFAQAESIERVEELSLEDYFQRFVLEHQDSMNETQLAKKLGISRKCLWERRQRFGIPRKKKQPA
ncbi:MAG: sigma-54 dependent transcriptional regulator [Gammaproteobacteria bacterium]|nr:sigma-54 dependent transcriptional regulator [Gammaproteobacteria bacterium]